MFPVLATKSVALWLFSLMTWLAPPEVIAARPQYPGWEESPDQKVARYEAIAQDIHQVIYDPSTEPLYQGEHGRARTAALVLAVAYKESGFAPDVDIGPCYRGKDGRSMRCDSGQSASMWQIKLGSGNTAEGWSQKDLFADRKKAIRAALAMMMKSFKACGREGPDYLLNAYASGVCGRGHGKSRERIGLARRMLTERGKVPGPDRLFLTTPGPSVSLSDWRFLPPPG